MLGERERTDRENKGEGKGERERERGGRTGFCGPQPRSAVLGPSLAGGSGDADYLRGAGSRLTEPAQG